MEKSTAFSSALMAELEQDLRQRRVPANTTAEQFAGRLGGNQEFMSDGQDEKLLEKHPDAARNLVSFEAPLHSIGDALHLEGFLSPSLWRMAIVEGWGTFLLVFLFGTTSSGLTTLGASPMATSLYAALVGWLGLMLSTFALGTISSAHLNPTITMATFFAGLSTFTRTFGLGDAFYPKGVIPGCTVDASLVSPGRMFILEYTSCQILIFTAFLIGLDQIASNIARPGYTGMSFNPARCMGMMTPKGEMQNHYVHWLDPMTATLVHGILYHFNPPWAHEEPLFGRALAFFGLWHPRKDSEVERRRGR